MSKSSFNDGVEIIPRYLNLSVYKKNSNSLIIMYAIYVAVTSVFDVPLFLLSPQ